jgi:hypothetical protein
VTTRNAPEEKGAPETPRGCPELAVLCSPPTEQEHAKEVLGGLHHEYRLEKDAA